MIPETIPPSYAKRLGDTNANTGIVLSNALTAVNQVFCANSISGELSATNLSVRYVTADEFHDLLGGETSASFEPKTLYIVSSDQLNAYNERILSVADPTDSTDAANMIYVDSSISAKRNANDLKYQYDVWFLTGNGVTDTLQQAPNNPNGFFGLNFGLMYGDGDWLLMDGNTGHQGRYAGSIDATSFDINIPLDNKTYSLRKASNGLIALVSQLPSAQEISTWNSYAEFLHDPRATTILFADETTSSFNVSGTLDRTWMQSVGIYGESSWTKQIRSISIGTDVSSIGQQAFGSCTSLIAIDIPNGIKTIGYYAFANCSRLSSIDIPSTVTSMNSNVFNNSTPITSIVFKDRTDIPANSPWDASNAIITTWNVASQEWVKEQNYISSIPSSYAQLSGISKVFIKDLGESGYEEGKQSDLSIIKLTNEEYATILSNESAQPNALYVISSDAIDAYGQQLKNLSAGTDLSDAVTLQQLQDATAAIPLSDYCLTTETSSAVEINGALMLKADLSAQLSAYDLIPLADSSNGSAGSLSTYARGDHQHPSDASKLDSEAAYPAWTGSTSPLVCSYKGRLYKITDTPSSVNVPPDVAPWWTPVYLKDLKQDALGYTPENAANKKALGSTRPDNTADYPTAQSVFDALAAKANATDLPYVMVTPGEWTFSGSRYSQNDNYSIVIEESQSLPGKEWIYNLYINGIESDYAAIDSPDNTRVVFYQVEIIATRASLPGHLCDRAVNVVSLSAGVPLQLPQRIEEGKSRNLLVRMHLSADFTGNVSWIAPANESAIFETEDGIKPFPTTFTSAQNLLFKFTETMYDSSLSTSYWEMSMKQLREAH